MLLRCEIGAVAVSAGMGARPGEAVALATVSSQTKSRV